MEVDDPQVAAVVEAIAELSNVELERPLPDISGSLQALKEALRGEES